MIRALILAGATLASFALPAHTEERRRPVPYTGPDRARPIGPGREHDWTGAYVGVTGGAARSESDERLDGTGRTRGGSPFPGERP